MRRLDDTGARFGPWAALLLALYLGAALAVGEELGGVAPWARVPAVALLAARAAVATAWTTVARSPSERPTAARRERGPLRRPRGRGAGQRSRGLRTAP